LSFSGVLFGYLKQIADRGKCGAKRKEKQTN
jgi:hypothetical protein